MLHSDRIRVLGGQVAGLGKDFEGYFSFGRIDAYRFFVAHDLYFSRRS